MDSDAVLIIGLVVFIILCAGDPDLLDALIHNLMKEQQCQ